MVCHLAPTRSSDKRVRLREWVFLHVGPDRRLEEGLYPVARAPRWFISPSSRGYFGEHGFPMESEEPDIPPSTEPEAPAGDPKNPAQEPPVIPSNPNPPIFGTVGSIDFPDPFVIIGDVGTGKSTVTPIHEFE